MVLLRQLRRARTECPGGPLAVDQYLPARVHLELRVVVREVVEEPQAAFFEPHGSEGLPREVGDELAVGEGEVRRRRHRPEIVFPLRALYGGGGELPVNELDAVAWGGLEEALDVFLADLVPETPGTGVDQDRDPPLAQAEHFCGFLVVYLVYVLDLEEVVPRPQGPELRQPPLVRPRGDRTGVRTRKLPAGLDVPQVLRLPEPPLDQRGRPLDQNLRELLSAHAKVRAAPAHPRGDGLVERVSQAILAQLQLFPVDLRRQEPHATIHIKTDAAGAHNAALFRVERGDSAYREAVAPVYVGHGQRRLDYAGQRRDILELPQGGVVFGCEVVQDPLRGVERRVDLHLPLAGDAVLVLTKAFEVHRLPPTLQEVRRRVSLARASLRPGRDISTRSASARGASRGRGRRAGSCARLRPPAGDARTRP